MAEYAKEFGIPAGDARRYRQFAELYSEGDLNDLYRKCRSQNFALAATHFRVLIGVKKKSDSTSLALKTIKQHLSVSELRRLARQKNGPRKPAGGRKPDILGLLDQKDRKKFRKRLQLYVTNWHETLSHLFVRRDDMDNRIGKSIKKLQASMANVDNVCHELNGQ